jgi:allantoate deiminase
MEEGPGRRVLALADALAAHTDEPGRITRLYLSEAHRSAAAAVRELMAAAGLAAHIDAVGNVVGRRGAAGAPALIVGSHIDSVVDAGRYDGVLGVLCGIVAAERLRGEDLPFALEVVAFGDEENVRFPTSFSTSNALAGRYDPAWLDARDGSGIRLGDALRAFGGDPAAAAALARPEEGLVGYLEVHIEQGPVLEAAGAPLGVVSAIAGITRARARVVGEAGHAGTVPMALRRDALAAAAEMTLAVERLARERPGTVATVGRAEVRPGAVNVIAGTVDFTLDVRAPVDADRQALVAAIVEACESAARRRGVGFTLEPFMDQPATPMDVGLRRAREEGARVVGAAPPHLLSGAGHDAAAMAAICPAAMLFVRCRGGVSHNPAEAVAEADVDLAVRALVAAIRRVARP